MTINAQQIHQFWFHEVEPKLRFNSTPEFDQIIRDRFATTWDQARNKKRDSWMQTPIGALSLVIVLDQFPLNMYRGQALSFSTEAQSREVANQAIQQGFDAALNDQEKSFLYLPYMHSENLADQEKSVELFTAANLEDNLRWAKHHRDIIRQFGRFPHRNRILNRPSTTDELEWLVLCQANNDGFSVACGVPQQGTSRRE